MPIGKGSIFNPSQMCAQMNYLLLLVFPFRIIKMTFAIFQLFQTRFSFSKVGLNSFKYVSRCCGFTKKPVIGTI